MQNFFNKKFNRYFHSTRQRVKLHHRIKFPSRINFFYGLKLHQRIKISQRIKYCSALMIATALVCVNLSACSFVRQDTQNAKSSDQLSVGGPQSIKADMPAVPAKLTEFYNQKVKWENCKDKSQCTKIKVPLDYKNPEKKSIELALKKRPANKKAIGSLLINPGGPGASGQEMIANANYFFPKALQDNFDIIGFDPRGVGQSAPVKCLSDDELGKLLESAYPDTPEGKEKSQADAQRIAESCHEKSGDLLPHVGTENAARDMDIIRHLAGDPRLYYLGYSYGTSLGGMYAELFPKNVGRMVLDGAVSSNISNFEQSLAQMKGFEKALDAYLKDCLTKNKNKCPFKGNIADARKQISYLLRQTLNQPVPNENGRKLTQSALIYGIVAALYDDATWPVLSQAFTVLFQQQNPSIFLLLFDSYTGRKDDKFINNSMEANWAINCADYQASGDPAKWAEESKILAKESPIFGATMQYNDAICAAWKYQPKNKIGPFTATGSAPIVVVGTTGDPATPHQWAKDFAKNLQNGHLVTWEGEGHTAYGHSTACVDNAINAYLLNGSVPQKNLVCPAK